VIGNPGRMAELDAVLYRTERGLEIMVVQQLFNVAIRRGEIGDDGWRDQW